MKKSFAFFDVDDTIISVKTMFNFFEYWCMEELNAPDALDNFNETFTALRQSNASREELNRAYYIHFAGVSRDTLERAAGNWWRWLLERQRAIFFEETVLRLKAHQRDGIAPVFISGSCAPLLAPIASALGVGNVLGAPLIVDAQDQYTGGIGTPQTIGAGKQIAILRFLSERQGDTYNSYAYGDDISDEPMLFAVGRPVAVGNGTPLIEIAEKRGWEILPLTSPKELKDILGTESNYIG